MSIKKQVEVLKKRSMSVFDSSLFHMEEAHLRHTLFNGKTSEPMVRISFERGNGVSALLHETTRNQIILIEQFRFPAYNATQKAKDGWLLELPAGILPEDETPEAAMRRELHEETGYTPAELTLIQTFFVSPGGSSERVHLFYAPVTAAHKTGNGGGLPAERENIRVVPMPAKKAIAQLDAGKIVDAKTIIALQWFKLKFGV